MPVLRALILIPVLVISLASASIAAPTPLAPTGYTRFTLGGPQHEFADIQSTSTGWVLVGTAAGESGDQPVVTSIDPAGRTLWQATLPQGAGFAVAVTPTGSIWAATVHAPSPAPDPQPGPSPSPAPTSPTSTETASPTPAPSTPAIDPDGVGALDELDTGRGGLVVALHLLGPDGQLLSSFDLSLEGGWLAQPSALVPWKDGVLLVGTALSPQGATAGLVATATDGASPVPYLLGTTNTALTSVAISSTGLALLAGSSGETLLGKARLGSSDAVVSTFNGTRFTKVVRSGGGQRTWNSIVANPAGGYTCAGVAVVSGRREAVVSNFSAAGAATWSKRLPGSVPAEEQRLIRIATSLRLVLPASTANSTLYPGWAPKGPSDLLALTLDPAKGTTLRVTVVASAGREQLVDAAGAAGGGALLLRSDGTLSGATGSGPIILARLGTR